MANTKLTLVKINSIDVSAYVLKWNISENFGNPIYEANIDLIKSVTSVVTLVPGQLVEIYDGFTTSTDTKQFNGELISYAPEPGKIKIKAFNSLYALVRNIITAKIYDKSVGGDPLNPNGQISDAFYDLVTTYGGLSATNGTTIQNSGTGIILTKLICDQTSVKERCDRLAEMLDWHYFYKATDGKVYFQPKQYSTNSLTLTVGTNVTNIPKWDNNIDDMINDLRVDGVFQEKTIQDKFSGDGATLVFTLSGTPTGDIILYYNNAKNYATASPAQGEIQTLGVIGSTTGYAYTVDKSTKQVTFVSAPGNATANNVLVEYVGVIAVPVHRTDDVSIATYRLHARTMQLTDVITVADADARSQLVINRFSVPFQSANLFVTQNSSNPTFEIGQSIHVVDSKNSPSVDKFFTIFKIVSSWPSGYDEISVGDRDFETAEFYINTAERQHRLERELISDAVLTELKDSPIMEMILAPDTLLIEEQYINDSRIWDHTTNGLWYDASETAILSDFESAADWAPDSGSITLTETNDSTSGHFWVGSQGLNYSWVATSGTGLIVSSVSNGDLSSVVGVSSGTPSRGTAGVWIYASGAVVSEVRLRIGSSSSNYKEYIGQTYPQKVALTEGSFSLDASARKLVLFDLDVVDATAGSINWTTIAYKQLRFVVTGAGNLTFDYCTCSKNDTISLNGWGLRQTTKSSTTTTY